MSINAIEVLEARFTSREQTIGRGKLHDSELRLDEFSTQAYVARHLSIWEVARDSEFQRAVIDEALRADPRMFEVCPPTGRVPQ